MKAKRVSTFQEFESNTSDAWDAGEDDDELLAMATESLNSEVVMETAHRVLRNHSQRQSQPSQKTTEPEPEPQPIAEPPVPPSGDLRLVKSVSESHTPCPSGRDEGTIEPRKDWIGIKRAVCLFAPGLWALRACTAIFHADVALPGPWAPDGLFFIWGPGLWLVWGPKKRATGEHRRWEIPGFFRKEPGVPTHASPGRGARGDHICLPWVRVLSFTDEKQIHSSLRPPC